MDFVQVQGRVSTSAGSSSRPKRKRGRADSDDESSDHGGSLTADSDPPRQQKTRSRTVTRSAEDGPAGVSAGTAIVTGTAAEAITSASEPTVAGSSTAPILVDIPLNHDGTMGPLNDDGTMGLVDLGSPPGFFEDLATWTPPPVNAILHTVTPPPSTSVPDPTFSFSPQTASQNPWQADRTFEF